MVSLRCDAEGFLIGLDGDDVDDEDNVTRILI